MDLSLVIPVYNEEGNIRPLHRRIVESIPKGMSYETIFVNDGSTDKTLDVLMQTKGVTIINFRKNFGQTAALQAGFDYAKGKVIISMDGDCQTDPADIPRLLAKLDGYDAVSGWRWPRRDGLEKRVTARIAYVLRSLTIRSPVHDGGCTFRAYKSECVKDLELYGEMHRYIPSLLKWKGYRVGEIRVKHYPRRSGKAKYSYGRVVRGFLDMLNVLFWRKYATRPLHIFGGLGLLLSILGFLMLSSLIVLRLFGLISLSKSLLPLLSIFLIIVGIQFFVSGLMTDIMIKNYYESTHKKTYVVRDIIKR